MSENLATDDLKSKAVKSAGINVAAQFLGAVCHIAGVVILARLLTPKDFGLVAMVTAFSQLLMNFGVNGFTEFIIQKENISREEVNSVFWLHILIAGLLAFCFIFFGGYLVKFYSEPALWGIAAAMSTSFILLALSTSHLALLKRDMKFAQIAFAELGAVVLSIIFAIALAIGGMTYWAVVARQLIVIAVPVLAAWILCPWRPGRPGSLSKAIPGLKYAIKVFCNFSLGYLTRNIDNVLVGKFHGSGILGNYDRAYQLSSMPANQLLSPLHGIALATLSRLRNDKERFYSYYTKAVSMVAFLGTIAALNLTLSAKDMILLLLGPKWDEAGRIVMALGPGVAAMLVYGTNSWLHLSLGTPGRWLRWNIFASVVTITAFIIAVPYGAVAMGIAYSIRAYILFLPALWYAGRPIQINLKTLVRSIWAYFTSAILVGAFWLYISTHWIPLVDFLSRFGPLSRITMIAFIASFLYIILVVIMERSFRSVYEIISLIRLFFSRSKT